MNLPDDLQGTILHWLIEQARAGKGRRTLRAAIHGELAGLEGADVDRALQRLAADHLVTLSPSEVSIDPDAIDAQLARRRRLKLPPTSKRLVNEYLAILRAEAAIAGRSGADEWQWIAGTLAGLLAWALDRPHELRQHLHQAYKTGERDER
jgi:hypothetical protein